MKSPYLAAMNPPRPLRIGALLLLCKGAALALPPFTSAFDLGDTTTAVFAGVSDDYARNRLPDGTYKAENYAFGDGGYFGSPSRDATIDNESFMSIARTMARPLADRSFIPTRDPKKANLLIMLYWGVTSGTLDPSSENFMYGRLDRPKGVSWSTELLGPVSFQGGLVDLQNAMILGYAGEIAQTHPWLGVIHNVKRDDLIDDVEHNRYFVVMMAYDFQMMWREKRHKLLWETRFSIREQGNDFAKLLPAMATCASAFFGQDSHGLIRRAIPEGNVEIGVPKTLAMDPEKAAPLSETTLIADADTFRGRPRGAAKDSAAFPPELAARIAAYEKEKASLQVALSEQTKAQAPGEDTRRALDEFNTQNSSRIAALNREADGIRSELAVISAAGPSADDGQSVDSLVRQFSDRAQEIQIANPLFNHP
jgi:hypothetical protein